MQFIQFHNLRRMLQLLQLQLMKIRGPGAAAIPQPLHAAHIHLTYVSRRLLRAAVGQALEYPHHRLLRQMRVLHQRTTPLAETLLTVIAVQPALGQANNSNDPSWLTTISLAMTTS